MGQQKGGGSHQLGFWSELLIKGDRLCFFLDLACLTEDIRTAQTKIRNPRRLCVEKLLSILRSQIGIDLASGSERQPFYTGEMAGWHTLFNDRHNAVVLKDILLSPVNLRSEFSHLFRSIQPAKLERAEYGPQGSPYLRLFRAVCKGELTEAHLKE